MICLPEFVSLLFKSVFIISYCCLKTQLVTWESGGEFTWRLSYWVCGMRGTDPRFPSSSSEVLKPFLMLAHTRQEHHCVFRTDFIGLQGLQNNFTCYFSHFLQQPCEAVDKYFHPCFVEGKLHSKKGRAGPQATVLYSHSGAGSAIRVSCPPSLTPLFCFTHQSQDLRIW